jgi:carbon monoxide dehydrogenase subunit G
MLMQMNGEEIIAAPREAVWKALNDTDVLKKCIPGCESITRHSATKMEAKVVIKIGPVKAGFTGVVNLSDMDPPKGYRISGEGKGGLAGFATGGADVRLEEVPEGTKLTYDVDAQVGGKLAMLGSRLIDSTSRSLAAQFFEKFAAAATAMGRAAPVKKVVKKPAKKVAKKPAAKKPVKKLAKKPIKKMVKKPATKKGLKKKS